MFFKTLLTLLIIAVIVNQVTYGRSYRKLAKNRSRKLAKNRTSIPKNSTLSTKYQPWTVTQKCEHIFYACLVLSFIFISCASLYEWNPEENWCIYYVPFIVITVIIFGIIPAATADDSDNAIRQYRPSLRNLTIHMLNDQTSLEEDVYEYMDEIPTPTSQAPKSSGPFQDIDSKIPVRSRAPTFSTSGATRFRPYSQVFLTALFSLVTEIVAIGNVQVGPESVLPDINSVPEDRIRQLYILLGLTCLLVFLIIICCCVLKSIIK